MSEHEPKFLHRTLNTVNRRPPIWRNWPSSHGRRTIRSAQRSCLDLVKAILLVDPENAEAQLMRSSIRMEMHLDLENARTLLRDAHLKDRPQMYSEAGNTVLRKILSIDPESEEAKTLLSEVGRSVPEPPPSVALPEPPARPRR